MNDQLDLTPKPVRVEPAPREPLRPDRGRVAPDTTPNATPAPARTQRRRRWVTPVVGLLVLGAVGYVGWRVIGHPQTVPASRAGAGGPPQSVGVATIGTGDIDVVLTGLGAVTPLATVTVKTQINGQLQQIPVAEGQLVHAGDFIAQIDPRPYQVALEQAQGAFAHDNALLNQAKADNARYQTLSKQDSISRQQVEDQAYLIKQYEGSVISDQSAIDSAKLNLAYCHIVSPVNGRIGIRAVDPGNYVQTSDANGLFVVTQLQPISVLFTLPEDDVDQVQSQFAAGTLTVMAYDRSDTKLLATGTLSAIDNEIDSTTGTVKLRAMFPNTDNALFPQQFVNVHLLLRQIKGAVVAPQAAVQHGAPGDFVYLVKPGNTVAVQVVKLGNSANGAVQITQGLKVGDKVVTDGLDRLRDGARITIVGPPGQSGGSDGRGSGGGGRPSGSRRQPAPAGG